MTITHNPHEFTIYNYNECLQEIIYIIGHPIDYPPYSNGKERITLLFHRIQQLIDFRRFV